MGILGRTVPNRAFISWGGEESFVVSLGLIDQTGVAFAPTLLRAQLANPALIDQTGSVFAPVVTVTSVSPELISQAGAVFAPTASLSLSPGLISQPGSVFAPTVSVGGPTVSASLIDQSGLVFAPEVRQVAVTVLVDTSKWDRRGGDVVRSWHGWPRTEPRNY